MHLEYAQVAPLTQFYYNVHGCVILDISPDKRRKRLYWADEREGSVYVCLCDRAVFNLASYDLPEFAHKARTDICNPSAIIQSTASFRSCQVFKV